MDIVSCRKMQFANCQHATHETVFFFEIVGCGALNHNGWGACGGGGVEGAMTLGHYAKETVHWWPL